MQPTVLITGGTGYIGAWTVKLLLEKGYTVRLTVRNKRKTDKYEYLQTLADNLPGKLEIWEADLLQPDSFDKAAKGAKAILHLASPFSLRKQNPQTDLIDPALIGTKNVLNAASKSGSVTKVVLTSSVAAIHGDNIDMKELGLSEFTEQHFNKTSSLAHQPYSYSKVLAEEEAWKIYNAQSTWKLVVINPAFVLGPPVHEGSDSESLQFMHDILHGKYRMGVPHIEFGFVDVRDVAKAHILALENNNSDGRHIILERVASVWELTKIIKLKYANEFKLPLMVAPKLIILLFGWMFGLSIKFIYRNVGYPLRFNTTKAKINLKMTYIPFEQTVIDMVEFFKRNKK